MSTWRLEEFTRYPVQTKYIPVPPRTSHAQNLWTREEEEELRRGMRDHGFMVAFAKRTGRTIGSVYGKSKRLSLR